MRRLVGRKFARLRRAKGLTQVAVEERFGFSQQYISDLERGLRNPTVVTLDELAQALDVNHVELVTPDDQVCPLFMKIMLLVDVARGGRRILREKFRLAQEAARNGGVVSGLSEFGLRLPAKFGEEEGGMGSATV